MTSKSFRLDVCRSFAYELKERYSTSETWNLKDLTKLKSLQVRDEEDIDHIRYIKNAILRDNKSINNTDPIIVTWNSNGDMILDGNHTLEALKLLGIKECKVVYVSEEEVKEKNFNKNEWIEVGLFLNENFEKFYKDNTDSTLRKHVFRLMKDGHDIKYCTDYLKKHGRTNPDTIIKYAREDYLNYGHEKVGKKVKRYGNGGIEKHKLELSKKEQELEDKDSVVIKGSTGSTFRLNSNTLVALADDNNSKKWKYEYLLYHDSSVNEENWKKDSNNFRETLERTFRKLKDVEIITEDGGKIYYPYQFNITIMPHLENDGSENID